MGLHFLVRFGNGRVAYLERLLLRDPRPIDLTYQGFESSAHSNDTEIWGDVLKTRTNAALQGTR